MLTHIENRQPMPQILLVEDNDANREMLLRRLKRRGFGVLDAVDGQQAVEIAHSSKPDLTEDMSLPVIDGWEATKRIKVEPALKHIPVIGLTAHAMAGIGTGNKGGTQRVCDETGRF